MAPQEHQARRFKNLGQTEAYLFDKTEVLERLAER